MKKILFTAAMALVLSASASAKTADELRIYINPGHGSWYSNDRPMDIYELVDGVKVHRTPGTQSNTATQTGNLDTLAFYESNTNLRKGFGVLEELVKYGLKFDRTLNQDNENRYQKGAAKDLSNNIVMSHVVCGPYPYDPELKEVCNRSLSEVAREVDTNNFDMFISIHSNAATEGTTTNYPLFLYRGFDTPTEHEGVTLEHQQLSRAMTAAAWPYIIENKHAGWTSYLNSTNLRGDCNFYASPSMSGYGYYGYLGVIKHGVPGYLAEGYFHTYQPARHRAMNWDADYVEGLGYAKGVADYFNLEKPGTGWIYAIARDANEKFADTYYKPNPATEDRFLPINGVTATLKKDGVVVAEKQANNYYNGSVVFMDLEPGTYTIEFTHPDYNPFVLEDVVVEADKVLYPAVKMVSTSFVPDEEVFENYPDVYNTPAEGFAEEYVVDAKYVDQEIAELEGKTVRRAVLHKGNIYVLAVDEETNPTVIVYDPAKKEVVANVSTEGMICTEGVQTAHMVCSDIQVTSDGYLVACNKEKTQYSADYVDGTEPRGTWRLYKWAKGENGLPEGEPELWITSQMTGNWYRSYAGDTFAYSGTSKDGFVVFSTETTGDSRNLRTMVIPVVDGQGASESFHQPWYQGDSNKFTVKAMGDNYRFITTPGNEGHYFIMGEGEMPIVECEYTHINKTDVLAESKPEVVANNSGIGSCFKYAGSDVLVAPVVEEGNVAGIQLVNVSKGLAAASAVTVTNGAVEAAPAASAHAMGRAVAVTDDLGETVVGGYMDLFLLRDNKLSFFTTEKVEQPVNTAVYAYALNAVEGEDAYTITFKATGDAPEASIIISEGGVDRKAVLGAVVKGDNEFTVAKTDIPDADCTWAIEIESAPIAVAGRAFDAAAGMTNTTRGGVTFFKDPEFDSFGQIAISYGFAQGINLYDQDINLLGNYWAGDSHFAASNGSSTMRISSYKGKAYVSDWSDAGAGYWIFDPENVDAGPFNYLAGTKNSGGTFFVDGVAIGGGNTSIAHVEYDGRTYMWVFCEDYPEPDASHFVIYDVTEAGDQIDFAPRDLGRMGFDNINVALYPFSKGVFAGQTRGAGNNAPGCPSFKVFDFEGNAIYNSGEELAEVLNSSTGAIAINPEENKVAVASVNGINIFNATFDEDDVPVLTFAYTIPNSVSRGYATEYTEFDFDQAGNLLAYERGQGLQVFALRNDAPKAVTAAKKANTIKGLAEGVEDIAIDGEVEANAPAVFYNIQGVQVAADNLTPGVYVKVQGKKATKVVVK